MKINYGQKLKDVFVSGGQKLKSIASYVASIGPKKHVRRGEDIFPPALHEFYGCWLAYCMNDMDFWRDIKIVIENIRGFFPKFSRFPKDSLARLVALSMVMYTVRQKHEIETDAIAYNKEIEAVRDTMRKCFPELKSVTHERLETFAAVTVDFVDMSNWGRAKMDAGIFH